MISRRMQQLQHSRSTIKQNDYGQQITATELMGVVDVSISLKSQTLNTTNPTYLQATHIGLTTSKNIMINDTLGGYKVLLVNPDGRYNQLLLEEQDD